MGVPNQATNEAELIYLARILLQQTILPILRPNLEFRITEATTIRSDTIKETVHIDLGSLSMPRSCGGKRNMPNILICAHYL